MVESLLILKRKNPRRTALMSFLGQIPKLMTTNDALFWSNITIKLFTKNTNHLLGQQLGGRSVDFVDSYRTRKGQTQGQGKINLGIFRLSLDESSATWLYLLVILVFSTHLFSLTSQLRHSFLHLSTHLTDGRKPFKSSKSIISHFSILSVLVVS